MAAKKKSNDNPPKATKSAAVVGPVEGTLETEADEVKAPVKPKKASKASDELVKLFKEKFDDVREHLNATSTGKPHRTLRWALKSIDAAEDAVASYIKKNL